MTGFAGLEGVFFDTQMESVFISHRFTQINTDV